MLSICAASVATLVVCIAPRFAGPTWRASRAATFSALGLLGVVPIAHQALHWRLRGRGGMPRPLAVAFQLELLMGALYLLGAFLFAKRMPERWWPGSFNYALQSHNLFHFLVVAAACVHVEASLILLAWRDASRCGA